VTHLHSKRERIAVFASGTGTNAENIFRHFRHHADIEVGLLISSKSSAPVVEKADDWQVPVRYIAKEDLQQPANILHQLEEAGITFLVLAGFNRLIPPEVTNAYEGRFINLHPALLPYYGGKGMYGMNVHRAVIEADDERSGISIHQVDERYDEGKVVFQATCEIDKGMTPEQLADRVHELEYKHYPGVIEAVIASA
jgi:phosphoribosylglycinamide formyltransferase-1